MELQAVLAHDRALRRERVFRDPLNPLEVEDEHLLRYYRFPRREILWLCDELEPDIGRVTRRSHAVPTHTQVLTALRFYASGSFQSVVGDASGLSQSSVSRIIGKVTDALFSRARREIKMPRSAADIAATKHKFYQLSNFPNVIGAIDCTHIAIKAPQINEDVYVNRKQYHSLNIQVIANSDQVITSYSAKYPGSSHDSYIWRNSCVRRSFNRGEFGHSYLLDDSGYPLEPFLMTPIENPANPAEQRYNRSHMRTRVVVEQTFGTLKTRFRCLHRSGGALQYDPARCGKIAVACMLLHNLCVRRGIPMQDAVEYHEEAHPPDIGNVNVGHGRVERQELIQQAFVL